MQRIAMGDGLGVARTQTMKHCFECKRIIQTWETPFIQRAWRVTGLRRNSTNSTTYEFCGLDCRQMWEIKNRQ